MNALLALLLACAAPADETGRPSHSDGGGASTDGGGTSGDGGGSLSDGGGTSGDGGGTPSDGGGSPSDGGSTDGGASLPSLAIYVLTGQSNSLGTTDLEGSSPEDYGPGSAPSDASTAFFWSNVSAANTVFPPLLYGDADGALRTLQVQQGDGSSPVFWGPEFGLARGLSAAGRTDLLIVKVSRGGGGNTWWHPPAFEADPDSGHMWGQLALVTSQAIALAEAEGREVELRGFLYLQGESNDQAEAEEAGERLALLIETFAAHVEALAPGATADMHTVIGEIAASSSTPARSRTSFEQRMLAEASPDISFVETADLPLKSDGIHFGRDAKLEIGDRMAQALLAAD